MADRIANELKALKAGDTNLHAHLQKLLAGLILDRAPLANFEAYSAVHRQNPPQDCVYRVREAYAHLRDYETRHRTLLGVTASSFRNSTPGRRSNLRSQPQ
ncbi:unnamed protein product [Sphagnum jensenii]